MATLATSTATLGVLTQLAALALLGLGYAIRTRTLRRDGRPPPGWRQACFYGGILAICAALASMSGADRELLTMRAAEHMLIGDVAALLIVLGLTGPLIEPLLRVRLLARLSVLANPLIAFGLWAIDLYVWHLAIFYEAALRHTSVHVLQHAMLFGFGVNLWMCLFGPLPAPRWFGSSAKLAYIVAVGLAGALLGNILLWSGTLFYPAFAHGEIARHISPVADQNLAGAMMVIESSALTLGLLWWLFLHTRHAGESRREPVSSRGRAS